MLIFGQDNNHIYVLMYCEKYLLKLLINIFNQNAADIQNIILFKSVLIMMCKYRHSES